MHPAATRTIGQDAQRRTTQWCGTHWPLALVVLVVLISRLPFLGAGYGADPDAWRVALTVRHLATTGEYTPSRLLGYPVQEFASALCWSGGPWAVNGLTALLGALGIGFFGLAMRALGYECAVAASLALGCVPVVYVNSTAALDGIWALSFVLAGLYFVVTGRLAVAGVGLGLAIGCRITSGAMLLPLALLVPRRETGRSTVACLLRFVGPAILIGATAYLPSVHKQWPGWDVLTSGTRTIPPMREIIGHATVEVWGSVGLLALLIAVGSLAGRWLVDRALPLPRGDKRQLTTWALAVGLCLIAFLPLPYKARYLLPAVPAAILLLSMLLDRRWFRVTCALLVLSSLVGIDRSGLHLGAIFVDHSERIRGMTLTSRLVAQASNMPSNTVIVVGWRLPQIRMQRSGAQEPGAQFVYSLDTLVLRDYRHHGFSVFYLPEMRELNLQSLGVDLAAEGAHPLSLAHEPS